MVIDELFNIHRIYEYFVYEWENVKNSVLKSIETNAVPNYKLLENRDADHEVRFLFCGVPCYVRFKYDLKRGGAEYGVLVSGDQDSRRLYDGRAMILHERTLARLFPQMLAIFFRDASTSL